MINIDRLALEFKNLVSIESPSKKEGKIAYYIANIFDALGYKCLFDRSAENTGSEVGNLIIKIPGTISTSPLFLGAHLDTVGPYENPKIIFENGIFKSDGRTILGADDKSAIAILIEITKILKETKMPHPPLDLIFTTCEEIGLLGAKYLDINLIDAREGFILDSENPTEVIIGAPSSYQFKLKVKGKSAHAGLEPEKGINAIHIISKIIAELPIGRIDKETTMNIGIISGGKFVNIVPEKALAEGEIRSHNDEKLENLKSSIQKQAEKIISSYPFKLNDLPKAEVDFDKVYQAFYIPPEDSICQLVKKAGEKLGLKISFKRKEGASDANVFNEKGLKCLILGTGMQKVHTTEEYIALKDMVITAELVLEIIKMKNEFSK
ncbi:M20/M25/M40 family metallo-hydrolase [Thermodesulfobacterium hydrogeniphilum]|uniref:M20/M25/M40 family metallo-hydrolase n=1 Tax=Thermodesulfobacterium hydrogeniphilum TaxID=161156 RepID=UPI00056EBF05|nr:M20/M25/M40 family metallo-hydrolase [Thermodesulfobacterium hydrogeniphilum]